MTSRVAATVNVSNPGVTKEIALHCIANAFWVAGERHVVAGEVEANPAYLQLGHRDSPLVTESLHRLRT